MFITPAIPNSPGRIVKKTKLQNPEKKREKKDILNNLYALFEGREKFLTPLKAKCYQLKLKVTGHSDKVSDHSNIEIPTPKQMLQRLPIVLAQVRAGNTSENLLNEIRQIIYSLYRAKEITKKV